MARLIPNQDPGQITNPGERIVAEVLCKQLPKDVVIFHSYPWLRPNRDLSASQESLAEGEADFVIVHPRFGFLIVEVKGGHVFFDAASQRWDRHGARHEMKDPFRQAARNLHALEDIMRKQSFKNEPSLPLTRGHCVIFPDCEWTGTPPPGAVHGNLFAASDLPKLGNRIEALFVAFDRRAQATPLKALVLDGIMQALTSKFRLLPALWREVEEQERQIFRFTEEQAQLLSALARHKRAAIEGVAGSGKTQLAMTKARQFADEGKYVLFLCFNTLLAAWLEAELPVCYKKKILIRNYHRLAYERCLLAGISFPADSNDQDFWQLEAPRLLENAIDSRREDLFDAVVVDEGQDFHQSWWDSVELLNSDMTDGPLYVFYDTAQRLFYPESQKMPHLGNPFVLPCNCRNTRSISAASGSAIGVKIPTKSDAPLGQPAEIILAESDALQLKAVETCLRRWLFKPGGVSKKQVAILTSAAVSRSSLHGIGKLAGAPVTDDILEWKQDKAILLTSLNRFKGLEADAIILCDVPSPQAGTGIGIFSTSHLYVGCSRGKHLLCVVARSPDVLRSLNQ